MDNGVIFFDTEQKGEHSYRTSKGTRAKAHGSRYRASTAQLQLQARPGWRDEVVEVVLSVDIPMIGISHFLGESVPIWLEMLSAGVRPHAVENLSSAGWSHITP